MTTNKSKPKGTRYEMKGPPVLTPAVIADIVQSRAEKGARDSLALKYGISTNRVGNIWKEYYGGGTMADYKTGIKKSLPTENVITADITSRRFNTPRATYVAKEPRVIDTPTTKAKVTRKLAAAKKVIKDLDLDKLEDMGDKEAEILAGEANAGNNSSELLEAIASMIAHNQNISERAVEALEGALKIALKAAKTKKKYYNDSEYDDTDIDSIDTDDSTAQYREKKKHTRGGRREEVFEDILEESEGDSRDGDERGPKVDIYTGAPIRLAQPDKVDKGVRKGSPRSGARAQPVYRTQREGEFSTAATQQTHTSQAVGSKSALYQTQHVQSQGTVQPDHAHNNTQQYPQPGQGSRLYGNGGNGSSSPFPSVPWLKRRA